MWRPKEGFRVQSSGTGSHEAGFPASWVPNPPHCGFWDPPQQEQCTALLTAEPSHQQMRVSKALKPKRSNGLNVENCSLWGSKKQNKKQRTKEKEIITETRIKQGVIREKWDEINLERVVRNE